MGDVRDMVSRNAVARIAALRAQGETTVEQEVDIVLDTLVNTGVPIPEAQADPT